MSKAFVKIFFGFVFLLPANDLVAQTATVHVIGSDSLPLTGVTINWYDAIADVPAMRYALTDISGKAVLQLSSHVNVSANYLGYESRSFSLSPGDDKIITLQLVVTDLKTVVVTGQLDETKPQQSAESFRVITKKKMEDMQANNVRDVLEKEMNVRVAEDNMLGSTITMQGLTGNNVKVMVDGVPVIGRENGNIDLSQLQLNNIQQIEIVEGPMSVLYSTDAVAGVINLISRKSNDGKNSLQLNLKGETPRSLYADGSAWLQLKKSHFSFTASRHYFDGYPAFDTTRVQQWKPNIKYFAGIGYGWKTSKTTAELKADYFTQTTLDRGEITRTPYEAYAFDKHYITTRLNAAAFFNYDITKSLRLDHTLSASLYERSKETYRKDLTTLETEKLDGEGTSTGTDISHLMYRVLVQQPAFAHKIRFQTGAEINWEDGNGDKILPATKSIREYAAIGQMEYQAFTKLMLKPGLRFNYNTAYDAPLIPSLNIHWQPKSYLQIRLGSARGYRAPSMKELYLSFVDLNHDIQGNTDLVAETSWNGNASVELSRNLDQNLNVNLNYGLFYHNISNQIVLVNTDSSLVKYMYANLDKTVTMGTDFISTFKFKDVTLAAGMALTGVENTSLNNKTAWSPEFNASLNWNWKKPEIGFTFLYKEVGTTPHYLMDENGLVTRYITDGYTLMDVLLSKSLFKDKLVLKGGAKNLLNVTNVQSGITSGVHNTNGEIAIARGRYFTFGLTLNITQDTNNKQKKNEDR